MTQVMVMNILPVENLAATAKGLVGCMCAAINHSQLSIIPVLELRIFCALLGE